MSPRRILVLLATLALVSATGTILGSPAADRFDHWQHRKLFPSCETCHAGIRESGAAIYPEAASCTACHDGQVERRVTWAPPTAPAASNLDFAHDRHAARVSERRGADSTLACIACHQQAGAPWMEVKRTVSRQCLDCHGQREEHLAVADTACATCHLTLAQATSLTREDVGDFPEPPSHQRAGFALGGHGRLARGSGAEAAASCATCHARDFCITCHVDAPERRAIQALAPDPRSLAIAAELRAPASHGAPNFLMRHGALANQKIRECRTCHTRESCTACHTVLPGPAKTLAVAGPGRGTGAVIRRSRPVTHGLDFRDNHAQLATSSPKSCAACHARAECLDCHRPTAATTGGYHPSGFLVRHPSAAYARESSCADCHNSAAFCASCHEQSGLTAQRRLGSGFHDAKRNFLVGHGQAARQNLDSCVSCHTERDCLTCHAAAGVGGRGFNPHGPGFDPDPLRRKNPETCTACHGVNIPSTVRARP